MQLQQAFAMAEEIAVYAEGSRTAYQCGSAPFEEICASWSSMLTDSVVMPAFGVSLNDMTVSAMKQGVWVEFCFSQQLEINELPFNRLLVEVKPNFSGFNVIRHTEEGGYSGRCFYIDLRGNTMNDFYNFITSK